MICCDFEERMFRMIRTGLFLLFPLLTGCATPAPFGYGSYWKWICGCASDLAPKEASESHAATEESSRYLEKVYSDVKRDFKQRDAILEETEKSFRALGFQLEKETDNQGRILLLRASIDGDISFKTGSAELTPAALEIVDKFGDALAANPDTIARVHGHTDTPGSKEMNRRLSMRRAQAVADSLIQRKTIAPARIVEVMGFADDRKIVPTNASEARNRRTEILIGYKKG